MCGIWGILNGSVNDSDIAVFNQILRHRGPDDAGFYKDNHIVLGHTRLSIIDPEKGQQPFSFLNDRYILVYNGEIYNYKELRKEILKAGLPLTTNSDTEVIAALYHLYGSEMFQKLRGMFAFALWDKKEKTLILARDRVGIKPLYFFHKGDTIIFASEIKFFIKSGLMDLKLNKESIYQYLALQAVPQPHTILKEVRHLPSGHYLVIKQGQEVKSNKYWRFSIQNIDWKNESEIIEKIKEKFSESIGLHLVSDVEVGAFLSGGIDSGAIAAFSRKFNPRIRTLSLGFQDAPPSFDETAPAKALAQSLSLNHQSFSINGKFVLEKLDDFIQALDQPSGDALNTFLLSIFAAREFKVILNGLGGDELFYGYPRLRIYNAYLQEDANWKNTGKDMRESIFNILHTIDRSNLTEYQWNLKRQLFLCGSPGKKLAHLIGINHLSRFLQPELETLFCRDFLNEIQQQHYRSFESLITGELAGNEQQNSIEDIISYFEFTRYMRDVLLRDVDSVSMFNSLEIRVPFLDHELVELAFSIPWHLKVQGKMSKIIFKKALKDHLPAELLNREKKGFSLPLKVWLQKDLKKVFIDTLTSAKTIKEQGIFDEDTLAKHADAYFKGSYQTSPELLWSVFILCKWLKYYKL